LGDKNNQLAIIQHKFVDELTLYLDVNFSTAILTWAETTSDNTSSRYSDLVRDKARVVADFFVYSGKAPDQATPADVQSYRGILEKRGLSKATIYASISRISSFYNWMMKSPELAARIRMNPVALARPKAPKAYQGKSTKSLTDVEVQRLLRVVKKRADSGDLIGKRDYALLLLYFITGMRREELISLRFEDVTMDDQSAHGSGIILSGRVKGGEIVTRQVTEPAAGEALLDYLRSSGRYLKMRSESPLWVSHDRGTRQRQKNDAKNLTGSPAVEIPLTSHGFVKNLKAYALQAGLGAIHLHQTRHTFARIVAEESGSLTDAQDALGHKNAATTRVYVQRVGTKKDKFSVTVAKRLKVDKE